MITSRAQAELGILGFGMLSALPSSSSSGRFGNTLTLATPDLQQRV